MTTQTVFVNSVHRDIGWQMNADVLKLMTNAKIGVEKMETVQIVMEVGYYLMENVCYQVKYKVE